MCLSKAYIVKDGKKKFLMTDIAAVKVDGNKLVLSSLFGDKKTFNANIMEIDFTANSLKLAVVSDGPKTD